MTPLAAFQRVNASDGGRALTLQQPGHRTPWAQTEHWGLWAPRRATRSRGLVRQAGTPGSGEPVPGRSTALPGPQNRAGSNTPAPGLQAWALVASAHSPPALSTMASNQSRYRNCHPCFWGLQSLTGQGPFDKTLFNQSRFTEALTRWPAGCCWEASGVRRARARDVHTPAALAAAGRTHKPAK